MTEGIDRDTVHRQGSTSTPATTRTDTVREIAVGGNGTGGDLASDGHRAGSTHHKHTTSTNTQSAGSGSPEGQVPRGMQHQRG